MIENRMNGRIATLSTEAQLATATPAGNLPHFLIIGAMRPGASSLTSLKPENDALAAGLGRDLSAWRH